MSDLTDRLRNPSAWPGGELMLLTEAANEIDRLRERVVKLERSQLETSIENNRLREALSVTSADDPRYQKYWTNLGGRIAERDRLREALTGLLAIDENTEPLVAKAAWLRAEAALAKEAGK
jgi:hypothetical protein